MRTAALDAEWLLDNFHIVEDVLREVRRTCPSGYDDELPKLAGRPGAGLSPRLRAGPGPGRAHRQRARRGADRALRPGVPGGRPADHRRALGAADDAPARPAGEPAAAGRPDALGLGRTPTRRALGGRSPATARGPAASGDGRARGEDRRDAAPLASRADPTDPCVVRLLQLLRDQGPTAAAVLGRLEAQLDGAATDANEVLRREHRRQAANQVSVGNCVISLRLLSAIDWNEFFERHSLVEAVLRDEPAGRLRRARTSPPATATAGPSSSSPAARASTSGGGPPGGRAGRGPGRGRAGPRAHVGYYLVDAGRADLEGRVRPRARWRLGAVDCGPGHPRAAYFGSIARPARRRCSPSWPGLGAGGGRVAGLAVLVAARAVLLLPASEVAVGAGQLPAHRCCCPRGCSPSSTSRTGIPADCATVVVMPEHAGPARRAPRSCSSGWRSTTWPTPTRSSASPC